MRLRCLLALTAAALACAPAVASAYPWPVRPFDRQHPIRGSFGDPRTLFENPFYADGINGPGSFSFHNGVDISARDDTAVYPVASGIVHLLDGTAVAVDTMDGRTFQYFHVVPRVVEGTRVTARQTLLGTVQAPYGHVHLSEIDDGDITNPLLLGHLTPYRDRTRPFVGDIELRNSLGRAVSPLNVCGRVSLSVAAEDTPALPVLGTFAGLPITPALVTWQLVRVGHGNVVGPAVAADFRRTLPTPREFWNVYARGTYENAPRFGPQQFKSMPGRFLFVLANGLDTHKLPNGPYVARVVARDERGNSARASQRFWILNVRAATGCRIVLPPPPPPTTTTSTTTTTTTPTTDPDAPPQAP